VDLLIVELTKVIMSIVMFIISIVKQFIYTYARSLWKYRPEVKRQRAQHWKGAGQHKVYIWVHVCVHKPSHLLKSASRLYPGLQLHCTCPFTLLQIWEHPPLRSLQGSFTERITQYTHTHTHTQTSVHITITIWLQ